MKKSYELVKPPVPAMGRAEYADEASAALAALLSGGECDERKFQGLLEQYPVLVPGTDPIIDAGQNGFHVGVISQPPLPGLNTKIPDFGVISRDSGTLYVTLIELESPCKRWATESGQPRQELTQAVQQIRDWRIWFKDPTNQLLFRDAYRIPDDDWRWLDHQLLCVLVYGRRSDLEASRFEKKRQSLQGDGEDFMSWDHVQPNPGLMRAITVKVKGDGYHALVVPPSTELGPADAPSHALIKGKQQAVLAENRIPVGRRRFMAERWAYWDDWASRPHDDDLGTSFFSLRDAE